MQHGSIDVQPARKATTPASPPLLEAFRARGHRMVDELAARLRPEVMVRLLATSTSTELLAELFADPTMLEEVAESRDPLAAARLRGARMRRGLLEAEGGSWTAQRVGDFLGIRRQSVEKRAERGRSSASR